MLRGRVSNSVHCNSCGELEDFPSLVVSRGNPSADLMIIGEAPGAVEQKLRAPFVGRSGKLLDKLLKEAGIDSQEDAYLCNVIKCRPPKNRRPSKSEIKAGLPWLNQQITLVDPFVIILVGSTAVEALLEFKPIMSTLRGTWQNWRGRLVMPLFHPSYLLRNPSKDYGSPVSLTSQDLIKVSKKLCTLKSYKRNSASVDFRNSLL